MNKCVVDGFFGKHNKKLLSFNESSAIILSVQEKKTNFIGMDGKIKMKKRFLAVAAGCLLCALATGCSNSVNAQPGDYVIEESESASAATVMFATAVSTEAVSQEEDSFELTGLNLANRKKVTVLDFGDSEDEDDTALRLQVYADAEKKLLENSFSYVYKFDGGRYTAEVNEVFRKNVDQFNCEWVMTIPEISVYVNGSKNDTENVSVDCSIYDNYEMVYVHTEDTGYKKNEVLLEDRYFIKDNATGTISSIVISVVRDTEIYGDGPMNVTRQYMADVKDDIYEAFNR